MATSSRRVLWKGAIAFGLVHIPIALHSATSEQGIDFDWLDKRSMDPVGYKRINKKTGKEIERENIVKGIQYESGRYVILSPEEIAAAYPQTTQTIEIESFVDADDIPFVYLERPYYTSPQNKAGKVYALLRDVLAASGKVGIAKVVIQTKQHLALLAPSGPALVLNLLRWGDEIRGWDELALPPVNPKETGVNPRELKMAQQLVEDMSGKWDPDEFTDSFKEQIMALVDQKVKAGDTAEVTPLEPAEDGETGSAKIYDLSEMLARSLKQRPGGKAAAKDDSSDDEAEEQAAPRRAAAKAAPAKKAASAKAPTASLAKSAARTKAAAKPAAKAAAKPASKTASKPTSTRKKAA